MHRVGNLSINSQRCGLIRDGVFNRFFLLGVPYMKPSRIPQSAVPVIHAFENVASKSNSVSEDRRILRRRLKTLEKKNKTWAIILTLLATGYVIAAVAFAKRSDIFVSDRLKTLGKTVSNVISKNKKNVEPLPRQTAIGSPVPALSKSALRYISFKGLSSKGTRRALN